MKNKIKEIADKTIQPYINMTDYELRDKLKGCGLFTAMFVRQYFEVGSPEYNLLYKKITDKLFKLHEKANANTQYYIIEVNYKQSGKEDIFTHTKTAIERTEQEAEKRIKESQFCNPYTGRKIKPIFINIHITPHTAL